MSNTRKISIAAIGVALSFLFLYLCCIVPRFRAALFCVATAFGCIVTMECGVRYAMLNYICTALLSALLLPNKGIAAMYILFFGYYPIIKLYIERLKTLVGEYAIKLGVGAVSGILMYLAATQLFSLTTLKYAPWIVIAVYIVAFILFDIALSLIIDYYNKRISRNFRKGK